MRKLRRQPQPKVTRRSKPVFKAVYKLLAQREAAGKKTYGKSLMTFNGRLALQDAVEEALDLTIYLTQVIMELDAKAKR